MPSGFGDGDQVPRTSKFYGCITAFQPILQHVVFWHHVKTKRQGVDKMPRHEPFKKRPNAVLMDPWNEIVANTRE